MSDEIWDELFPNAPSIYLDGLGHLANYCYPAGPGGTILSRSAVAVNVFQRANDIDGFTVRDAAAVSWGVFAGQVVGGALGAIGANPFTVAAGAVAGGITVSVY